MKINGRVPLRQETIGPNLEARLLSSASTSMDDFRSKFIMLMMGKRRGPGGNFDKAFEEMRSLSRIARHAVTMITNQVSILGIVVKAFGFGPLFIFLFLGEQSCTIFYFLAEQSIFT